MEFSIGRAGSIASALGIIVGGAWFIATTPADVGASPICKVQSAQGIERAHVIRVADTAALTDEQIAYIYIQANLFEVETAELGKSRGTSEDVRSHGETVAKDHRGVVKMFEKLLHMNHIKPIAPPNADDAVRQHQKVLADLKAKNEGEDFDKAYIAHEAKNHRAVIDAIRTTLLPNVQHAAISRHMKDVLPAFEHHLEMTVSAAQKFGLPTVE